MVYWTNYTTKQGYKYVLCETINKSCRLTGSTHLVVSVIDNLPCERIFLVKMKMGKRSTIHAVEKYVMLKGATKFGWYVCFANWLTVTHKVPVMKASKPPTTYFRCISVNSNFFVVVGWWSDVLSMTMEGGPGPVEDIITSTTDHYTELFHAGRLPCMLTVRLYDSCIQKTTYTTCLITRC